MESRPPLGIKTTALAMALRRSGDELASVSEYAKKTGMDAADVLMELRPLVQMRALSLEEAGNELFLHTAPQGRPVPQHLPEVPANQWEELRERFTPSMAFSAWKIMRKLEAAGWRTEANPTRILSGLGRLIEPPICGVVLGNVNVGERVLPVVVEPDAQYMGVRGGILEIYEAAGAGAIAVTVPEGGMEKVIGAIRVWVETRGRRPLLKVYLLEEPNYNPVLISPLDRAIEARSVSQEDTY